MLALGFLVCAFVGAFPTWTVKRPSRFGHGRAMASFTGSEAGERAAARQWLLQGAGGSESWRRTDKEDHTSELARPYAWF